MTFAYFYYFLHFFLFQRLKAQRKKKKQQNSRFNLNAKYHGTFVSIAIYPLESNSIKNFAITIFTLPLFHAHSHIARAYTHIQPITAVIVPAENRKKNAHALCFEQRNVSISLILWYWPIFIYIFYNIDAGTLFFSIRNKLYRIIELYFKNTFNCHYKNVVANIQFYSHYVQVSNCSNLC